MELGYECEPNNGIVMKCLKRKGTRLNSDTILVVKFPNPRILFIVSRSLFLAMVILTLPSILATIKDSPSLYDSEFGSDPFDYELLPLVLRDLADEGILRGGNKALVVSSGASGLSDMIDSLRASDKIDIELVSESDLESQKSVAGEVFDVVFARSFQSPAFINRVLKTGGVAVMQLSNNPSDAFEQLSNYKIVYLRRFTSTVVAMRKMTFSVNLPTRRRLCGVTQQAKRAALNGLEDALLEPPRRVLAKPTENLKNFNFLPDLLGDSLEGYNRRIFITDENKGVVEWFNHNYPTRNQDFEIYEMKTGTDDDTEMVENLSLPLKDVKEEDYVVMKAEAQMVELMIREKTICLVDELFLECKTQWEVGEKRGRRAYWECLALYGRVRDEGVAVHQWWG